MLIDHALTSQSVTLKSLNVDNFSQNYPAWLNDKELNKYTEARFNDYSLDEVKNFILKCNEADNVLLLGIHYNGVHVGNIKAEINPFHKTAAIGLLIGDTSLHGKGIGHRAISLITDYLLKDLDIYKVNAGLYKSNIGSLKAFKKSGFKIEYTKNAHVINGEGDREDVIVMVRYAS